MLVTWVPQQWIGKARTVLSPASIDTKHNFRQARRPLHQELLADDLQISHHQLQDATIVQVIQQEFMNILLLYKADKSKAMHN